MRIIAITLLALAGGAALAADPAPAPAPQDQAPGANTRAWLQMQAAGREASPRRPTLSGAAMQKAYERYVDSFGQPIPPRFSRDTIDSSKGR